MAIFDQFVEAIKLQLQPPPRAIAIANTLRQLSAYIPKDVTLADLVIGWQTLSRPPGQEEEKISRQNRRITCGELAHQASQFTTNQGNLAQAIKTWGIWQEAFDNSDDPRHVAMTGTFARELAELQATIKEQ